MGCSKDSRFLTSVGYVHKDNLVGKAEFIFHQIKKLEVFSLFGNNKSIRFSRTLIKLVNKINYQS